MCNFHDLGIIIDWEKHKGPFLLGICRSFVYTVLTFLFGSVFFSFLSLQTPWLEYIDYMKVRDEQQAAAQQWEIMLFRTEGHKVKLPVLTNPEDTIGPNERILKR